MQPFPIPHDSGTSRDVKFTLRQVTEADYDFLFALHRAAMKGYIESIWGWNEEWQAEYFRKKFDPSARQMIVVDDRDAGVLVVEERPTEIYLGLIELLPEYQGRGIGTAVLNRLIQDAADKNLPLTLDVLRSNQSARKLYERLGFVITREGEFRFHMRIMTDSH